MIAKLNAQGVKLQKKRDKRDKKNEGYDMLDVDAGAALRTLYIYAFSLFLHSKALLCFTSHFFTTEK